MKLHFLGADHEVTGSLHFLEICGLNIAVDCGMEQGRNQYENEPLPIPYRELDYILVTHAHIDHTGMIPYAYKQGFRGQVICSNATMALSEIMLRDSAHIQMQEAEWRNRKGARAGLPHMDPVYDLNDANQVLDHFHGVPYHHRLTLKEGLSIEFLDAGHLLGSANIRMTATENGESRTILFSGDIGNKGKPLIRDPDKIEHADYILMESTYGNRLHEKGVDHLRDLAEITQRTLDRGGNVVLPAFAVGRTQELLYLYNQIKKAGLIKGHDGFPVYVDSPLAVEATHVFSKSMEECFDEEIKALVNKGINPISFPNLRLSITLEESKTINADEEPKVIISASGMCDAGRIRHHIKHNIWRKESTIVFAGYQAEGTLGRLLLDGADTVRLFGEEFAVRAEIAVMGAMSSHADQDGLMEWISNCRESPKRVFLVHGEDASMAALSDKIRSELGFPVDCPYSGSVFDLISGEWLVKAEARPVREKEDVLSPSGTPSIRALEKETGEGVHRRKKTSDLQYVQVLEKLQKLQEAVESNYGGSNRDLKKLAKQLEDLYTEWKR